MAEQRSWSRLVVEATVIVFSILLALILDAAWEDRSERVEEREVLGGLEEEFQDLAERLNSTSLRYATLRAKTEWLLDSVSVGGILPVVRVDSALVALVWPTTFDPGSGSRDALLESGRLELLRNGELRRRLSGWEAVLDEARDNEQAMRTFVLNVTVPFLASMGVETGRLLAIPLSDFWRLQPSDSLEAAERYRELVYDPEFRSLARYRYAWTTLSVREFERARDAAREILALIRAELED